MLRRHVIQPRGPLARTSKGFLIKGFPVVAVRFYSNLGQFAAAWELERYFNEGGKVRIDVALFVRELRDKLFVG